MNDEGLLLSVRRALRDQLGNQPGINRRHFIKLAGFSGAGLVLAAASPAPLLAAQGADVAAANAATNVELNAFVEISTDGTITIYSANAEMGQGIKTALPMIIAEELGARWEDVRVVQSPIDEDRYGRQFAGGSTTVNRTFDQMRQMGASAREMFISAGSLVMEVPRTELKTEDSRVVHDSGRYMTFAQLATLAAKQEVPDPEALNFKDREDYRIIGSFKSGVDNLAITTGLALFGIDAQVPDMLFAAYQKCPAIGGKVVSANLDVIRKLPGVVDAFLVEGNGDPKALLDGVAIVGNTTHAVFSAKRQLEVVWDENAASKDSWTALSAEGRKLHGKRGPHLVIDKGDVADEFSNPDNTVLDAYYEYPFVAHLCMEPMNATADYRRGEPGQKDTVELWVPHQGPVRAYEPLRELFQLESDQVTLHQMRLGGSFGRRVYTEYICEVTEISRRVGKPVKLTWTREDDIHHDFFRVGGFQSVKAAVNPQGQLVAFEDHFIGMEQDGNPVMGSRFRDNEFPIENVASAYVSQTMLGIKTPCGPWRAPGSNTNAFVTQSFLAEVAHAARRDYVEFLLEILGERRWFEEGNIRSLNTGRAADVIRKAARESGWGRELPAGRGLGLAFYFCHAAHVAEVAEVSVDADRNLTIHKITAAVDVGPIINMSGALSQVKGSIVDGLSTAMLQKITMEDGRIEQSNFNNYPVLRIPQTPQVDVHFIQSDYEPTGLGEPALPPLAPAVGNAIFAANGERLRKMPFSEAGYTLV
jgi:isoquinoline 1-oxidoreductase beta subunit